MRASQDRELYGVPPSTAPETRIPVPTISGSGSGLGSPQNISEPPSSIPTTAIIVSPDDEVNIVNQSAAPTSAASAQRRGTTPVLRKSPEMETQESARVPHTRVHTRDAESTEDNYSSSRPHKRAKIQPSTSRAVRRGGRAIQNVQQTLASSSLQPQDTEDGRAGLLATSDPPLNGTESGPGPSFVGADTTAISIFIPSSEHLDNAGTNISTMVPISEFLVKNRLPKEYAFALHECGVTRMTDIDALGQLLPQVMEDFCLVDLKMTRFHMRLFQNAILERRH